ncbi:MAG: ATP-binding cassette domain-containing protein [Planctomycetia bacterium]|nr:ATP-binding cassette domain-containing protein [Planctomycetia bacterium]NCF99310.1 ATP-binding cassette domain-containing protein [Planctomycetia bacterium]NCG12679.1 ATP-binding cassette domain-containing protein [Planctomycetia bacterium]NCG56452.1 ATP-binding cassette domain-containing protein [Pseudomonadota bacterium]
MHGISRHYGDGVSQVKALDDVDLSIQAGEFVAIVGASGSGKSTLLQILGCLDRADSGQYLLAGKNVLSLPEKELARVRNEVLGFVFQSFHLLGDRNALDNVRLPLEYRRGKVETSLAEQMLERVQLSDRVKHFPSQLSGGERQRVAIARALVKQPQLLLCDEPTGNLDSRNGQQILDLLSGLREEYQTTLVLVTHDTEVADRADRVVTLKDGRWSEESS